MSGKNTCSSLRSFYGDLLLEMADVPYVWGGSSTLGSDCSGSLCYALNGVFGTDLRYTADTLYKRFFTRREIYNDSLKAVFFIDREQDKAVHVAGCIGGSFYMNVSSIERGKKGTIRNLKALRDLYPDYSMDLRALDEDAWLKAGGVL